MFRKILSMLFGFYLLLFPTLCWGGMTSHSGDMTLFHQEGEHFSLLLGVSILAESGEMAYTIQGPEDGGWKSSLEWPLKKIWYAGGVGSLSFSQRFTLTAGVWEDITNDAGMMKDSDWLYAVYGNTKVIYSETHTTVSATHIDVNARYNLGQSKNVAFGAILGYALTKWDWTARDGFQWTVNPLSFYYGPIEGTAITYKQELKVPYLGGALSISPGNSPVSLHLYVLYSPLAKCDDEDDHVIRSKLSQGKTDGTFVALGGNLRVKMTSRWSVTGTLHYSAYDLKGTQTQYFYAGADEGKGSTNIDLTVEGSQAYFGLTVGYAL